MSAISADPIWSGFLPVVLLDEANRFFYVAGVQNILAAPDSPTGFSTNNNTLNGTTRDLQTFTKRKIFKLLFRQLLTAYASA
jgi:hypothetical protein